MLNNTENTHGSLPVLIPTENTVSDKSTLNHILLRDQTGLIQRLETPWAITYNANTRTQSMLPHAKNGASDQSCWRIVCGQSVCNHIENTMCGQPVLNHIENTCGQSVLNHIENTMCGQSVFNHTENTMCGQSVLNYNENSVWSICVESLWKHNVWSICV